MTKAVAKANESAVIVSDDIPAHLQGVMQDQRGSEEVAADDLVIPRIDLIQGLSKVRKKTDPNYIEGAEEGQLYNVVTRQLYGEEVMFVPVYFQKQWLLWRDADLGGGFGGAFSDQASAEAARQQMESPDEWENIDTPTHYVLVVHEDGTTEEAVISMAKTKAKASRYLNSLARINGGPRFSRVYKVKGVNEQNRQGQDYYTLQVETVGFAPEPIFKQAEHLYDTIKSGNVTVAQGDDTADAGGDVEF